MNQIIEHNFYDSLAQANTEKHNEVFKIVYRKMFPNLVHIQTLDNNGIHQKQGIDVMIVLNNSKTLTIDQKIRFNEYDDIGLEFANIYADGTRKAGWINDPDKQCDYIAYARIKQRKCYMLPFIQLKNLYEANKKEWISAQNGGYQGISDYPVLPAANRTGTSEWKTWSVYLPVNDLLLMLVDTMVVEF